MDLTPVDFLSGLGGIANLPNPMREQQDAQQSQIQQQSIQRNAQILGQQDIQQQRAQQYQADVAEALKTGQFASLYAKYPEQQKELQAAHDALDKPTQDANKRDLFAVRSFITNGSLDSAKAILQKRVDADKAAGLPADEDQQMLDAINSGNASQVKAAADMALYAILPEDKRGEIFGKQGKGYSQLGSGGIFNQDTGEVVREPTRDPKTVTVKNADGSESIVQVDAGGGGQASGGGAPGSGALSVRLNNPGAIRFSDANDWKGQVGHEGGFVKFATPADGERAHRILIANQIKKGFDTPAEWAAHYAPASDGNDPAAYAATIAKGLGIGVGDKIPLSAVPKMAALSAQVESGGTPAPGGTTDGPPGAKVLFTSKPGDADGPDKQSVEYYAQDIANGGTLPALGSGKTAAAWRQAILKRAAEINQGKGLDGADNTLRVSDVKAARMALGQLQKTQSNVRGFERTFMLNVDEALRTAPKGVGGSAPVFNRWIQAGRKGVKGDPDVSAFNVAINTAANEYAKLASGASGGAVTSDSARHEAMDLLNTAQTLPQLQAAVKQMKIDGHNRITAMNEQEARLRSTILGRPTGTADAPKMATPVKVSSLQQAMKLAPGTPYIRPDGKRMIR